MLKPKYSKADARRLAKKILSTKKEQEFLAGSDEHDLVLWLLRERFPKKEDLLPYEIKDIENERKHHIFGWYHPDGHFADDIQLKMAVSESDPCKSFCFYFKGDDDEWHQFSYSKALMTRSKRKPYLVEKVFRHAVLDQTHGFKLKEIDKNPELKEKRKEDVKSVHTDHKEIPFAILLDRFLELENLKKEDVVLAPLPFCCQPGYEIEDDNLKKRWQQYHKENATLQLLSAEDNILKSAEEDIPFCQKEKQKRC